ncbi:unnamed protein product [Schistosoma margrebowiei]|uniref:Uncharacterized protein n=1 Tax=Schistosoma margrebowiei TaxID=48269 RepID=A0A183M6A6_9TREM|nr:unnamed protein product [Schistosoma margrebowiei]
MPDFTASAGILSGPAAFPLLICLMTIQILSIVDGVTSIGWSVCAASMGGGLNGAVPFKSSSKHVYIWTTPPVSRIGKTEATCFRIYTNISFAPNPSVLLKRVKNPIELTALLIDSIYFQDTFLRLEGMQLLPSILTASVRRPVCINLFTTSNSNAEVRHRVFGRRDDNAIGVTILKHGLRWLGHVLRMLSRRIPRRALFADSGTGWKKRRGGRCMTWCRGMKESCKGLASVVPSRRPSCNTVARDVIRYGSE